MSKNLEKADTVVKLTLAVSVLIFYLTNIINGPFARTLAILAAITIVIFIVRFIYKRTTGSEGKHL